MAALTSKVSPSSSGGGGGGFISSRGVAIILDPSGLDSPVKVEQSAIADWAGRLFLGEGLRPHSVGRALFPRSVFSGLAVGVGFLVVMDAFGVRSLVSPTTPAIFG